MADQRKPLPNTRLRAARELEFQMGRGEFAKKVNEAGKAMGENVACGSRLVADWEDGKVVCPRAVYQRILTKMTGGRSMADLGFRLPTPAPPAAGPYWPEEDRVERPVFLLDGAAAILALPLSAGQAPGKIGASEVRAVKAAVIKLYARDHDHGSAPLHQAASEALHTAYQWLQAGTYTSRTESKLRSATGGLAVAAGWLSYDSGRAGDAHSLYGEALAAARIADDPELEAHAVGCLSLLAKAQGRPREAISAAQGAQAVARNLGSPRLLSLFNMREAGGWALMGDTSATDQAIVRAHTLYAKALRRRSALALLLRTRRTRGPGMPGPRRPRPARTRRCRGRAGGPPARRTLREESRPVHGRRRHPTCGEGPSRAGGSRRSRGPRPRVPPRSALRPAASVAAQRRRRTPTARPRPRGRRLDRGVPHHRCHRRRTGATPSTRTDVVIHTYGPGQVPPMLDTIADIWADAHPELVNTPGAATDGLSAAALRRQVMSHLRHEGFTLVAAFAVGSMVGFGYAFPCTPEYWYGPELLPEIPEHVRAGRLMGLCELTVTPARQSQGIGSRLHTELLKAIDPDYASLLVRPDNRAGRTLYERLGYKYAGPYRNEPGGPVYDLLLLQVDKEAVAR